VNNRLESLSAFVDDAPGSEKTLLLVNRTGAEPLLDLLSNAFTNQTVRIAERHVPEGPEDIVCLIDGGSVVATSPFRRLLNTFVLVNADRYRTGTRPVDPRQFPDVLTELTETDFTVAGYPASNKEKLLLVLISRFIEHLALAVGRGELHTTFQRLSMLDDEYGTRTMYRLLSDSGVETHVYGVSDDPVVVADLDVIVHTDDTEAYRRSWVVKFSADGVDPPGDSLPAHAALVAFETKPNVYRGLWTYERDRVERIDAYVEREF
jgi:hypothetical protein